MSETNEQMAARLEEMATAGEALAAKGQPLFMKGDFAALRAGAQALREQPQWLPITNPDRGLFLVTNNMAARNAHGYMSHVWVTTAIHVGHQPSDGRFWCHDENGPMGRRILGLTHCQSIRPLPPAPSEDQ